MATAGCGSDDPISESDKAMGALCDRMIECNLLDQSGKAFCITTMRILGMYIVDPESVGSCFEQAQCNQLSDSAEMKLMVDECLDLDKESFECREDDHLYYCNNKGVCKEIDCEQTCQQFIGTSNADCDFVEAEGYDKCICYL